MKYFGSQMTIMTSQKIGLTKIVCNPQVFLKTLLYDCMKAGVIGVASIIDVSQ